MGPLPNFFWFAHGKLLNLLTSTNFFTSKKWLTSNNFDVKQNFQQTIKLVEVKNNSQQTIKLVDVKNVFDVKLFFFQQTIKLVDVKTFFDVKIFFPANTTYVDIKSMMSYTVFKSIVGSERKLAPWHRFILYNMSTSVFIASGLYFGNLTLLTSFSKWYNALSATNDW